MAIFDHGQNLDMAKYGQNWLLTSLETGVNFLAAAGPESRWLALRCKKKLCTLLDLCVSSLRRGHANLLCIVPSLTDGPRRESNEIVTLLSWGKP